MNVTGPGEVFAAGAEGNRGSGFVDQVASVWANYMNAKNAIGFGVGQDFDGAVHLAQSACAGIRAERESALSILGAEVFSSSSVWPTEAISGCV